MTEREKDILKIARKGAISSADAAFRLGIRLDEACRLLRTMTAKGALVRAGREVSYAEVPSQYGHDAFLMPIPLYHDILRDYLARVAREVNAHAA